MTKSRSDHVRLQQIQAKADDAARRGVIWDSDIEFVLRQLAVLSQEKVAWEAQRLIYEEGLQLWNAKEEGFKAEIHRANLGVIVERTERDNRVVEMSNRIDRLSDALKIIVSQGEGAYQSDLIRIAQEALSK